MYRMKFVGSVFFLSAVLKLFSFQETVQLWSNQFSLSITASSLSLFLIMIIELYCAYLLWENQKNALKISTLLLVGFSLISIYQYFIGAENCGCFGTLLNFSPFETILKNLILITLLSYKTKGKKNV